MIEGFWKSVFIGTACGVVVAIIWGAAHETIATECRKLGSFYVGQTVFECRVKE